MKPDSALETMAVHAGREDLFELGVHALPLDLSTTYPLADLAAAGESMGALGRGEMPRGTPVYARMFNPTVDRFERGLARLEKTESAVAFGSGMAALTAALLALRLRDQSRHHVVAVRPLYGGSDTLLASGLLGFEVTFTNPAGVAAALRPDTGMVVLETPGNPTLDLVDIARAAADARGVPVLVDSTFMTPVLQRPVEHGATLVLHSGTKFLGGHGDVIAGVVCGPEEWARALRQVRILTGALLHPLAAYLLHRGLQTLPQRVRAAQDGARIVAERLAGHPAVEKLLYPGMPGCDPAGLVGRQMEGPGSMLSFEVASFEVAAEVMRRVELITPAVSLGSTDSLIQHPAGLTHRSMAAEAKAKTGISPGLLRLSVGLEDPRDVWADLEQALDAGLKLAGTRAAEAAAAR